MNWTIKNPRKISALIDIISGLTGKLAMLFMGAITFIAFYEVVMRYVFKNPTGWTIEFVPYLILWGTFIGGSLTLKEDRHIKVDLLVTHLPPKVQLVMQVITGVIAIVFCGVLFVKGIEMVSHTKTTGTITPGTQIPVYIPQLCIPIGAGLLVVQLIKRVGDNIACLRKNRKLPRTQNP